MQEYCVSDKGKRRRIEEMNANRGRNRDRPNQHQTEQAKTPKAVNTVSGDEARDSRPQNNRGGRSDRSNSNRGRRENSGRRQKVPYYAFMAETRVIGRVSAPSSRRRKKSWTGPQTPNNRRSPSITLTTTSREACHHKFSDSLRKNLTRLRHIPPCHHPSQPSTTTPHTPHQPF